MLLKIFLTLMLTSKLKVSITPKKYSVNTLNFYIIQISLNTSINTPNYMYDFLKFCTMHFTNNFPLLQ